MQRNGLATAAAIEAIYRERFHEFVRVAEAICRDADTARDAVQDGFAGALRSRQGFRGESGVETWLWSCVVNAARNARRRATGLDVRDELAERRPSGEPTAARAGLPEAIAALPERQRLVLFLRYYADLEYAAIAETLGIGLGTVGATLNHAHAALRRRLEEAL
jgi:RNA polymerase sigma factor (sigma-70 family)